MKQFRARFTVCDLRVTVAQVNGWLKDFDATFRLKARKYGCEYEVYKYAVSESDSSHAEACNAPVGQGSARICGLLCYKQFAYFANANCERKTEDSATAIHNRHAD